MLRKSDQFLVFLLISIVLVAITSWYSIQTQKLSNSELQNKAEIVKKLGLTDLALFTEARYTRNLSQTDLHSPFQDHPTSLEHFPTGSLLLPPEGLKK